jgi:hypothetical protein
MKIGNWHIQSWNISKLWIYAIINHAWTKITSITTYAQAVISLNHYVHKLQLLAILTYAQAVISLNQYVHKLQLLSIILYAQTVITLNLYVHKLQLLSESWRYMQETNIHYQLRTNVNLGQFCVHTTSCSKNHSTQLLGLRKVIPQIIIHGPIIYKQNSITIMPW